MHERRVLDQDLAPLLHSGQPEQRVFVECASTEALGHLAEKGRTFLRILLEIAPRGALVSSVDL